jgi:hypothetical protein
VQGTTGTISAKLRHPGRKWGGRRSCVLCVLSIAKNHPIKLLWLLQPSSKVAAKPFRFVECTSQILFFLADAVATPLQLLETWWSLWCHLLFYRVLTLKPLTRSSEHAKPSPVQPCLSVSERCNPRQAISNFSIRRGWGVPTDATSKNGITACSPISKMKANRAFINRNGFKWDIDQEESGNPEVSSRMRSSCEPN